MSIKMIPSELQLKVIESPMDMGRILAIKAGPGSGKSTTLMRKVERLVSTGVARPEEILILSMTNRSVDTLRRHLGELVGEALNQYHFYTFHSFCGFLIEKYAATMLPTMQNKILLDDTSWRCLSIMFVENMRNQVRDKHLYGINSFTLDRILSDARSGTESLKDISNKFNIPEHYVTAFIDYLDKNGMIRYSDLITNVTKMLLNHSEYGNLDIVTSYKVIIVDEFQDVYPQILSLIQALRSYPTSGFDSSMCKHLVLAGDCNQGMYRFLGADPELINDLNKVFPGVGIDIINLKESFRLSSEILASSNSFLDPSKAVSDLRSIKSSFYPPISKVFTSKQEFLEFAAEEIARLIFHLGGLLKPSDFVILCRINQDVEEVGDFLFKNYGIECNRLSQALQWINSKVNVFLVIISLLNKGSGSDFALLRLLMYLDKSPGAKDRLRSLFNIRQSLEEFLRDQLQTITSANERSKEELLPEGLPSLSNTKSEFWTIYSFGKHKNTLIKFKHLFDALDEARLSLQATKDCMSAQSILNVLHRFIIHLDLSRALTSERSASEYQVHSNTGIRKEENLRTHLREFTRSLESALSAYDEAPSTKEDLFLSYFIRNHKDDISLSDSEKVNVSTIHSAKGLEFPVVFVLSPVLEFDRARSGFKKENETARLLYVASTRAKNFLYYRTNVGSGCIGKDNEIFTDKVPEILNSFDGKMSLLLRLSQDLDKSIPSKARIHKGKALFASFEAQGYFKLKNRQPALLRQMHTTCVGGLKRHFLMSYGAIFHVVKRL